MEHDSLKSSQIWRLRLAVLAALAAAVAGCEGVFPIPDNLAQGNLQVLSAGQYWLQARGAEVSASELPAMRGAPLKEARLAQPPAWFAGDGLYVVNADGDGTRIASAQDTTLDAVLAGYDPLPAK